MRVSADPIDPDYIGDKLYRVFLDGVEVLYCVEADTEKGTVVVSKVDGEGQFVIDDDHFVEETLTGVVTLEEAGG